ncbi:PEP-CTERM sorting domain-containing protein [Desmonostoc muscorum LEGE 12446]|uniref:PEP-CTERM sorting domain-containing protein n=1 Tax=Desmonostoc muscorum TaxID=1179 RepID=UPI001D158AC7|nr:PEP-CTERM sorting domain-containing protein [Desmonostoc muscorum]MCF2145486.1 PEP-CTERM sorting domain-containing protein [Desmonostoc muscorum LEGE 12446]
MITLQLRQNLRKDFAADIRKVTLSTFAVLGVSFGFAALSSPASAALLFRESFDDAALSIDAFGSTTNNGTLQTDVPVGATVLKAYLYASSVWENYEGPVSDVKLNGNLLKVADAFVLTPDENATTTVRWDVTSLLSSLGGLQNHTIEELGNNDGETLVVSYQDASTTGLSSFILDGELSTTGDTTRFNFDRPYSGGDFIVSFADTYSSQPSGQYTIIDVTTDSTSSRRLTSSAGGSDDGEAANGALITAGGIGDSLTNPDPFATDVAGSRTDDELYNLALGNSADPNPFIRPGDTFIELNTSNPSNDDNVYSLFVTSKFKVSVPEPLTTLGLLAVGGFGLAFCRKSKQQPKDTAKA